MRWGITPPRLADLLRGYATAGNQIINPQTILRHPAVWRGVDLISTSVARIPFDVYRRLPDGRESAIDYPAYRLLKMRPNGLYSRFQLIRSWLVNTLTYGDGFVWIGRDEFGDPTTLQLLESSDVVIAISAGHVSYVATSDDGSRLPVPASDILHLRGLGSDGLTGKPIYRVLAEAFGLGLTLQRYQTAFFANAGRPSVVIKLPPEISTQEQVEEFRAAWGSIHGGGPENAFRPAMLRPGADIVTLQSDSAIESLANLREHDLVTIANCLGIVPHRLGAKSVSVSYGSLEQENLSWLQDLDGWTTQVEQEMSLKLIAAFDAENYYIEGNREALVQPDSKTKAELLSIYRRNGMLSDQEIRRRLNMGPPSAEDTFWTESSLIERSRALRVPLAPGSRDETSLKLASATVARLLRRADKAGHFEIGIWQEEFGELPGWNDLVLPDDELRAVLPEQRKTVIATLDARQIAKVLLKCPAD